MATMASMRPPEFTGGNGGAPVADPRVGQASMRPPEFTGGNRPLHGKMLVQLQCFNEAAGIHRRKQHPHRRVVIQHQHASMRPPEFTGGNRGRRNHVIAGAALASMRPPEFTGGNVHYFMATLCSARLRFNEAAGIHRRKPLP